MGRVRSVHRLLLATSTLSPLRFSGSKTTVRVMLILFAVVFSLSRIERAQAATFNIGCSGSVGDAAALQAAITTTNTNNQDDTVNLTAGCTYTLTATLSITADNGNTLTINGNGATISGNNVVRVFFIAVGAPASANVALDNLIISNGSAAFGSGIYSAGTLTITNSTFSGNSANGVAGAGGGIYNQGVLSVTSSTFSGNSSSPSEGGGGIYNIRVLSVTNSTFSNNSGNYGGGILNEGSEAIGTVTNSTFSGNAATISGGGIANNGGATLVVTNSTFSGNSASSGGGGIANLLSTMTLRNNIIANSTSGGDCIQFFDTLSVGINLIGDGSCNATISGNPSLGALQNNGGSTQTFALNSGSLAIDAGDDIVLTEVFAGGIDYNGDGDVDDTITTDQRGQPRVQGSAVDLGAFEVECASFPYTVPAGDVVELKRAVACANSNGPDAPGYDGDEIILTNSTYTVTTSIDGFNAFTPILSAASQGKLKITGNGATIQRVAATNFRFFDAVIGSVLTIDNVTLTEGRSVGAGGAIRSRGTLTITNSTFSSNISIAPNIGGAISSEGSSILTVLNSAFINNSTQAGGAIASQTATIINSTFSGNTSTFRGGAIFAQFNTTITNSTFTGNGSPNGASVFNILTATLNVSNSIFAGATVGSECGFQDPTNVSIQYTLIQDGSCGVGTTAPYANGNLSGDPQLGVLQNNGGSTVTRLPNSGSPVIDAGSNGLARDANGDPLTTDQRGAGFARIQGASVDMGAVEVPLSLPIVSISATDPDAAEASADTGTFTITRTGATTSALDVTYTVGGTATNGTDYTPTLTGTVTIPVGQANATITITPTDDALVEGAETVLLTLTDGAAYDLGATTLATVTITSDDVLPTVSITATDANAAEAGADTGTFTITRTGATASALDVTYTVGGTATNGTDYTPTLTGTVTIPVGQASATIIITPTDDALVEGAETVLLTLTDGAAYDLGTPVQAIVTITSDDMLPTVSITATDPDAAETGADTCTFTITRTGATSSALDVTYTIGGTATNGTDYTPTLTGTVTIPVGQANATITITPTDDALVEGAETVLLTLTDGAAYDLGVTTQATVTITDNDVVLPTLSINDVSLNEGNSGTTDYTFTVSLNSAAGAGGVTFDIATTDNTATVADGDYNVNSLTGQTIAAGSSSYTFTVTVNGDPKSEPTETFFVNVTNITGASAGDAQGQGTITNDDVAGVTVTQTAGTTDTTEAGGTDTFTVVLTAQPQSNVVITVTSGNTAEVTVDQAVLTFTPATWNTAQIVTATGVDDAVVDGNQNVTVTISVDDAASNDAFDILPDQQVIVTNADDDVIPTVSISATDPNAAEAGADTGTFTIIRTGVTTSALDVTYTIGGTATNGTDYTPTLTGTVTIPVGQANATITITPTDDSDVEGDETVSLTLLDSANYDLDVNASATVLISDNDVVSVLPVVSISATDPNAAEAGIDTGTFVVSRTGATTGALDVTYTVGGTATNGTDYTPTLIGTATIPDGQTSVAISITPVNDTTAESAETVVLILQADAAYTLGTPSSATVTITDNDGTAPTTTAATTEPAPPLCSLIGGGTNRIIRADVPGGLNANVFCRILVENSVYVQRAAEVGDGTLVNAGIIQAVDVFGFTANGVQVADFNLPITVCLQGNGRMFYRDATNAPRITVPLTVSNNNGYTCASIPNAGTVILVP